MSEEATVLTDEADGVLVITINRPEGLVITAAHVTNDPKKQMKVLLSDGRELTYSVTAMINGF